VVCDLERLDFFLSSLSGAGGGGGGGGGGATASTSFSLGDSKAFNLSAIFPPTGFFVSTDAFIENDADAGFRDVVVSLGLVASGSFALSAAISPLDASFLAAEAASEPLLDFLVAPKTAQGSTLSSLDCTGLRSMSGSGSGSGAASLI